MDKVSVLDITTSHLISSHTQEKKDKVKKANLKNKRLRRNKMHHTWRKKPRFGQAQQKFNELSLSWSLSFNFCLSFFSIQQGKLTHKRIFLCIHNILYYIYTHKYKRTSKHTGKKSVRLAKFVLCGNTCLGWWVEFTWGKV